MELIDTHAHLTFDELQNQVDAVLSRSRAAGVVEWVTIGTDRTHMDRVLQLVPRYPAMWAALGYHPHYANDITEADIDYLKHALQNKRVVAVGETGLDYHYDNAVPDNQKRLFRTHLDIAAEMQKPVIIHTRDAFEDTMDILDQYAGKLANVVVHCYGGDAEQTRHVLDKGYYVSFTGTVTFKRSDALREVAKTIPPERTMLETDCPYISPEPVRRVQPNEPALLIHTAACLARLHGMPLEQFAALTTAVSRRFFGISA
ncbi:MAG: TatD family hydrolase [Planctomycetes bacterium]|jgi:TatD DNase family protein|nr:TatD family hydrolase [Planctomycetota bacterium]